MIMKDVPRPLANGLNILAEWSALSSVVQATLVQDSLPPPSLHWCQKWNRMVRPLAAGGASPKM